MERMPKSGELYRHFKNKLYQIIGIATHSETREPLVIYQALYGEYGMYARPLSMFTSEVDHEKYPEITQRYRFTKVEFDAEGNLKEVEELEEKRIEPFVSEHAEDGEEPTEIRYEQQPDPKLMEFIEADTFDEKYNVLVSMRDTITDKLVDDLAVVLDVVIPEGDLTKRYDELKLAIQTKQRYEYASRLR